MNILSIDFGTKNIGLAWCDTGIGVVLPFGKIKNQESRIMNHELGELAIKEKIDKVVIGLPMGLDGKENTNTVRVRKFGDELQSLIQIPVEYYDERFSSQAADAMGGGVSRDEKSAMIILEGYLTKVNSKQ
jgi:putative Holliday junction resolvase